MKEKIRAESRSVSDRLGRLVELTVWADDAHPAYGRASISRFEGYHVALAVVASLVPLAVEPARAQDVVNTFLCPLGRGGDRTRDGAEMKLDSLEAIGRAFPQAERFVVVGDLADTRTVWPTVQGTGSR